MKKLFLTLSLLMAFGYASAQVDPKSTMPDKPIETKPQKDTMSANTQIKKESDMKTMDAVKTQDHKKITPDPKTVAKDTVAGKRQRSGSKK